VQAFAVSARGRCVTRFESVVHDRACIFLTVFAFALSVKCFNLILFRIAKNREAPEEPHISDHQGCIFTQTVLDQQTSSYPSDALSTSLSIDRVGGRLAPSMPTSSQRFP
jgi:hypothetical protein